MAYDDNLQIYARIDQTGIEEGMDEAEENVRHGLDNVNDTIESSMDDVEESVQHGLDNVNDAVESSIDDIEESISHGLDDVNDAVESSMDDVEESISHGLDNVSDTAENGMDDVEESISHGLDNVNDTAVSNGMDDMEENVRRGLNTVNNTAINNGMDDMEENVRRGLDTVNSATESKMSIFSGFFIAASQAAGQAIYEIASKAKDSLVSILTSGDEYNKAMNQLSASTGATGEELEKLKEVAKGVFADNYGESYDDVADAVANVKKQLGDLPADQLQTITESAFALSDTFEYDVAESTRAAKAMVDNFGISGEYAMELIAAGTKNNLNYSDELIDSINEYSVQFAKVGLNADDMFKIFQNGAENGAWNLDKIGDAVKEFSIRAIDGSASTAEGFEAIGLNADEMAWKFTQGGDTAKTAFKQTVAALISMEDPIARDAAGVALFGTMWEDLGVDAVASLGNIQDGAYATGDAINAIKQVKFNDIGSAVEGLKRSIGSFTIDARAAFSTKIAGAIGTLVNAINSADGDISVIFDGVINALKQVGSAFAEIASGWAENGKKIIEYLISGIKENLPKIQEKAGEIVKFLINGFLNSRKQMIEVAIPIIQGLVEGISEKIPEIMNEGLAIFQSLVTGIIDAIPQLLPLAINIITSLINGLSQAIVAILEFAPQILTAIINGIIGVLPELIGCAIQILDALITAIIDNLEPILTACLQILMAIVNGIIDNLDKLIDAAFQIIQFLIDELLKNDNLQKILDATINIIMAITDGIIDNLDKLIDAAFQIIDKIISELLQEDNIEKLINTGIELLVKIIVGLCRFAGRLAEFATKLFTTLGEEIAKIDWSELGENVLNGIMSGLTGVDFDVDDFTSDFGDNWITGFKDIFDINSPSGVMRDEVGKWLLPGIAVGVEDTSDETADNINNSLKNVSEQLKTPEIKPFEITQADFSWDIPEQSEVEFPEIVISEPEIPEPEVKLPKFPEKSLIISSPEIRIEAPEKIEFNQPEIAVMQFNMPEKSQKIEPPEVSVSEPEPIRLDSPEIEPPEIPEQSEVTIDSPEIEVSEPQPVEFEKPEIEPFEIPEQSEITIDSPEIAVSETQPIEFESPETVLPDNEIFTQQIEILRELSPKNSVPELDDKRITAEIQSQLDEIIITLNADNFISRFEAILSGMGNAAVPQYSEVYGQIQNVPEKSENSRPAVTTNTQFSPKISVFIGDTEIKDFVISAIDEANAISGGASV